jgi:hypothetical protein
MKAGIRITKPGTTGLQKISDLSQPLLVAL